MSKRILIIDDSASVRQQIRQALEPLGFDLLEAVDGLDGAEKIEGNDDLDAVICDVNMPNMTGLEMLERVKPGERPKPLPVVMLTTEGHPEMIKQAKAHGAKGWMVKPFKPEMLVAAMQKLTAA